MKAVTPDKRSNEPWPGRFELKATIANCDKDGNEGHVVFWRNLPDHEIAKLYAELGRMMPGDPYEASQVEDTFSAQEVEVIKAYYAGDSDVELEVIPAHEPLGPQVDENGREYCPSGMSPFGDLYSGFLYLEDVLGGVCGTVTHYVTPDNMRLEYDETFQVVTVNPYGDIVDVESDRERAVKEVEEQRQKTRHMLEELIDEE